MSSTTVPMVQLSAFLGNDQICFQIFDVIAFLYVLNFQNLKNATIQSC